MFLKILGKFMQRHHESALMQALDQLYLEGATSIRWDYLYMWSGQKRLSKGVYRDINLRWEELCRESAPDKPVPQLTVLSTTYTLTLVREPLDSEKLVPLKDQL